MDVVLIVFGNIVVHHKRKIVYLKSAGSDIGCNKECCLAFLELVQCLLPLRLRKVSGKVIGVVAVVPEPCTELLGHMPAVGEQKSGLGLLVGKQLQKEHELLRLGHMVQLLGDALHSDVVRLKVDFRRIVHEVPCKLPDAHLQRSREQQGLPVIPVGQVAEHLLYVGIESHVEHPVRLVYDKCVYA